MQQRHLGLLMAITTGICWALLAIALRQALYYASTGTIVWFRMLVAFVWLVLYYAVTDRSRLSMLVRARPLVLVAGFGLALNYFGYMRGLELTSASNAQIMIQMGPLFLLLFGVFYFGERPSRNQTIGLIVAGVGFGLFFWDQILLSLTNMRQHINGDLWLVLASFAWALFAILQKGLKGDWTAQQFNMVMYGLSVLLLWPTSHTAEIMAWDLKGWLLLLACGLNTLVAYGAFAEALRRAPASQVSLIIAANPLLTILLVAILSSMGVGWVTPEPIAWRGVMGALLVVGGVILTVVRRQPRNSMVSRH